MSVQPCLYMLSLQVASVPMHRYSTSWVITHRVKLRYLPPARGCPAGEGQSLGKSPVRRSSHLVGRQAVSKDNIPSPDAMDLSQNSGECGQ